MEKDNVTTMVYVAGPYTCNGRCEGPGVSLTSMKNGIEACIDVLSNDMAPFCPWNDYLFALMDKDNKLPNKWYYRYSNSFLAACDAMYVINCTPNSFGVHAEIKLAEKLGIPVFYTLENLVKHHDAGLI